MPIPVIHTPREAVAHYENVYNHLIEHSGYQPFLYPWSAVGGVVVIVYLLIDHRRSPVLRNSRFLVFGFVASYAVYCCATMTAQNPAAGFGLGLISSFSVLWINALMVCNDCQSDFQRIERRALMDGKSNSDMGAFAQKEHSSTSTALMNGNQANGNLRGRWTDHARRPDEHLTGPANRKGSLFWQSYPNAPFIERLDWILDMLCSFRGVGWNWQVPGIPDLPKWAVGQLRRNTASTDDDENLLYSSKHGIRRYHDRGALLRITLARLALGYMALDLLKTLFIHDTYFWLPLENGHDRHALPAPEYLPIVLQNSAMFLRSMRLLLSLAAIYTALWTIFHLGPFFFCFVLKPERIGLRGEPWMNPDMFGGLGPVFDKGLAGWWGAYWHQTFRFAFEAPTTTLLNLCRIDKRSLQGKVIGLAVAFFLSGCLHATGSFTQLGETRPLLGPMRFFLLQGIGVLMQTLIGMQLKKVGILEKVPLRLRQLANFLFAHFWLYHTAALLIDDFAAGGVWLLEPVPFSILRGLGLGATDDGWWCWYGSIVRWHSGQHWWTTGLAL